MASSQLNAIFDAIAGWDVYYDSDVNVKIRELQNQASVIKTMEGMVRNIVLGDGGGRFVAMGKTLAIDWEIVDTLYLRPTSHLGNIRVATPQLANYIVNYIDAIQADRSPTNQSHIESFAPEIGSESYPVGGDEEWFIARITLTVREFIS